MNSAMPALGRSAVLAALPLALLLGACRDDAVPTPRTAAATTTTTTTTTSRLDNRLAAPQVAAQPARSESRGHVVAIEAVSEKSAPSGAGAVIGGVLGGVIGNQVGGGDGRKAATVLGAVGGAVVGNKVEKDRSSHVVGYRVSVRTEAGNTRQFQRASVADLAVGAPVRIVDGDLQPA